MTIYQTQGPPSQQQYVTRSNSSTVPQATSSGLISSLVCPYPLRQTNFSWDNFSEFGVLLLAFVCNAVNVFVSVVITNASWKYEFLGLTICTISPLVTTSLVNYSNGVVNTTVSSSRSLGSGNTTLTQFLAAIVDYQSRTTQGLTTNTIGDALYSIYVSASGNHSCSTEDVTNLLLLEMVSISGLMYCQIERTSALPGTILAGSRRVLRNGASFPSHPVKLNGPHRSSTLQFLRSAFSAYPRNVPAEAQISLNGSETIRTMGWCRRSSIWEYTIIPITVVALMMYAAVAYTLWQVFIKQDKESFSRFDPSNPIHLMMVSSTRDHNDANDDLEDWLGGFERGGIGKNENMRVQLMHVTQDRKRFVVTDD